MLFDLGLWFAYVVHELLVGENLRFHILVFLLKRLDFLQFSIQDFPLGLQLVRGQCSVLELTVRQILTVQDVNPRLLFGRLLRLAQCGVGVRQHFSLGGKLRVLLSELFISFLSLFDLLAELIVQLLHLVCLDY